MRSLDSSRISDSTGDWLNQRLSRPADIVRPCRYYMNGVDAFRLKLWLPSPADKETPEHE